MRFSSAVSICLLATSAHAQCGSSLEFSEGRHIVVPRSASIQSTVNAFTIEAWIYPTAVPSPFNAIAGTWNDLGVNQRSFFIALQNGVPAVYVSTDGSNFPSVLASVGAPLNTWTHVAGTYDGANLRIYVNGILRGSAPQTGTVFQPAQPFYIGRLDGAGIRTQPCIGSLDEVRLWSQARSAAQIAADMGATNVPPQATLLGSWSFNENAGFAAQDSSGNGNTGSLTNPPPLWSTPGAPVSGCCPADLNHDGFVEDADFIIFVQAYNVLDCADAAMPAGCPADFNADAQVDDTDFQIFVVAYNELICQ
jgi:hypothetical protein